MCNWTKDGKLIRCIWAIGVLAAVVATSGCGRPMGAKLSDISWDAHKATVESGALLIPAAVEMETLFPDVDHFIIHYGVAKGPRKWQSSAFFGGRYELTMEVEVEIDYVNKKVTKVVGEPSFYLKEVSKVDVYQDGRAGGWYDGTSQREFGAEEWQKLYKSNGDVSVLGVVPKTDPVPFFDKFVEQARKNLQPISLLNSAIDPKD
jgi:hypothetical protein